MTKKYKRGDPHIGWLPSGIALNTTERDAYTVNIRGIHKEELTKDILLLDTYLRNLSKGRKI